MHEQLLASAGKLSQPPRAVAEEFAAIRDELAERGNTILDARDDLQRLIGQGNKQMARDNNRNFARFMQAQFTHYNPEAMVNTILWVFRAYRSHGFKTTYWAANLNIWVDLLRGGLSQQSFDAIYPFYDWMIVNIPLFTALTDQSSSGTIK
ncbi:hypothetical protein [Desulfoplanes sp.]